MATVDVVLPFHNVQMRYVRAALESIMAQTYSDWRAIIVNDGSDDESTSHIESLVQELRSDKILYLKKKNGGCASARNAAIRASDSPYIALLDPDDAWYPHKLESQLAIFDRHPDVALVHSGTDMIDSEGRIIRRSVPKDFLQGADQKENLKRMLRRNFVSCPTAIFRRDCGKTVGFFDEAFRNMEDKVLWVSLLARGYRIYYQNEPVAMYRVHSTNQTKNYERLLRARKLLISKIDGMAPASPVLQDIGWRDMRKEMVHHMFREIRDGYIEQRRFLKAILYYFPFSVFLSDKPASSPP